MANWKSRLEVFSSVLMVVAAATLLYSLRPRVSAAAWQPTDMIVRAADLRNTKGLGQTVLIMVSDYECPFCAAFHRDVYPTVEEHLLEEPGTQFAMVNMPLERIHTFARKAAEATECAGVQGRYWEMFDHLFLASPNLSPDRILGAATDVGVDLPTFEACLAGDKAEVVTADLELARSWAVTSTPSFLVGTVDGDVIRIRSRFSGLPTTASLVEALERARSSTTGWRTWVPWL